MSNDPKSEAAIGLPMDGKPDSTEDRRRDHAADETVLPEICPWLAADNVDRMAREVARDAYRVSLRMLSSGEPGTTRFGVQHVSGRVFLTLEVKKDA